MLKEISASIVQGSAIGPAAYVVYAADLQPVTDGNDIVKFADDTYLVIPASNIDSQEAELNNVDNWALTNNLQLNRTKSMEIVFRDKRQKRHIDEPTVLDAIKRVSVMKILGVTFTNGLSVGEHISDVIQSCARMMYALRVLRSHGCQCVDLQTVFRAKIVAKLTYASSAWIGLAAAHDRQRVNGFLHRCIRSGMCNGEIPSFDELCEASDTRLFENILNRPDHLLHPLLPAKSTASNNYRLRHRKHQYELPPKRTRLINSNFLIRMLFTDIY